VNVELFLLQSFNANVDETQFAICILVSYIAIKINDWTSLPKNHPANHVSAPFTTCYRREREK